MRRMCLESGFRTICGRNLSIYLLEIIFSPMFQIIDPDSNTSTEMLTTPLVQYLFRKRGWWRDEDYRPRYLPPSMTFIVRMGPDGAVDGTAMEGGILLEWCCVPHIKTSDKSLYLLCCAQKERWIIAVSVHGYSQFISLRHWRGSLSFRHGPSRVLPANMTLQVGRHRVAKNTVERSTYPVKKLFLVFLKKLFEF